jgi:hypothetical protein
VISDSTWSLAGGAFNYQDLGPQTLKGIPAAVRAWSVMGENSAGSRFAARTSKGVTPLVGRIDEIGMMRQRWERAVEGDGQVILLSPMRPWSTVSRPLRCVCLSSRRNSGRS